MKYIVVYRTFPNCDHSIAPSQGTIYKNYIPTARTFSKINTKTESINPVILKSPDCGCNIIF